MSVFPMEVVREEDEIREPTAETALPDRRQNPWLNPQFLVQLVVIIVGVYVASQVRISGLESNLQNAATNLNEKATRMEAQVNAVAGHVNVISTQTAEMRATVAAQQVQINDLKGSVQMYEARIIVLEKAVARAEARADVR